MSAKSSAMAVRRLAETVSRNIVDDIYRCSFKKQTGVSLKYMMDFGAYPTSKNLLVSAQFLHKELPVRLAHRVTELENLPHGLSTKAPVLTVRDWYVDSFKDLRSFSEIQDVQDELRFTELIHQIKMRHNNVMPTMAIGIQELKADLGRKVGLNELPEIHQFLDRFYMSRIGIRMLIGMCLFLPWMALLTHREPRGRFAWGNVLSPFLHFSSVAWDRRASGFKRAYLLWHLKSGQHVALHQQHPPPAYIGLICTKVSPVEVAKNAIEDARSACMRTYGSAPEVHVYGDPDFTFAYVPTHLHQMLFELVKNSLRAVQERFQDDDRDYPPIRVVVADGLEDVTIKISDEGGGIPRSGLPKIWTYLYSTAKNPVAVNEQPSVMAGYGYGLPISRLYARYFGGDLQVISMEGYGTDAYLHLNRLGNVQEPLP